MAPENSSPAQLLLALLIADATMPPGVNVTCKVYILNWLQEIQRIPVTGIQYSLQPSEQMGLELLNMANSNAHF